MDNLKIGQIISSENTAPDRDAVHMAVVKVVAAEKLKPGEHVYVFKSDSKYWAERVRPPYDSTGIVDPFLKDNVITDDEFWLFLYPGSITSLRHDWTHPSFENEKKEDEESWLKVFAEDNDLSYGSLIEGAKTYQASKNYYESYICFPHNIEYDQDWETFWLYFERVTGIKPKEGRKDGFFTCSC